MEIEADDAKFQHLLRTYHSQRQVGARRKFQLSQYRETYEAATEVLFDQEGELMCEDDYYLYVGFL